MPFSCNSRALPGQGSAAGFTLIEVLVALAIVGLALGGIARVFTSGLQGVAVSSDAETALAVAEMRLAMAADTGILRPGRQDGIWNDRVSWQVVTSPFRDPAAAPAIREAASTSLMRIEVTVRWRDGIHDRQLALDTLRLAEPAP